VFDEVDEKTMTSLISMLAMNLGVFVTEEVQVLTEKSSFHLNELYNKEKRVGLFIELEGDMKENSFATMVIWQIADKMKNMKEQGEVAKYVVNFYLDNFDMIPRLPDAEQLFVGSRTSMYNFILCLQDLTNLANKYFDRTPFILMNSPFYVFYPNSMDEKTVEFVEEYAKNSVEGVSEEVVDYLKEVYSIFRSGYVMIATPKFPIFVDTALHEDGYVEVTEA
jgi:type IV secretory pathway TraG/TraD family ATPase VirD4